MCDTHTHTLTDTHTRVVIGCEAYGIGIAAYTFGAMAVCEGFNRTHTSSPHTHHSHITHTHIKVHKQWHSTTQALTHITHTHTHKYTNNGTVLHSHLDLSLSLSLSHTHTHTYTHTHHTHTQVHKQWHSPSQSLRSRCTILFKRIPKSFYIK